MPLGDLKARYFGETPGSRVRVRHRHRLERSRPPGPAAAARARPALSRLYYADQEHAPAAKHRHMTATQAAEFARDAAVGELVLIHFAARYRGRYEMLIEQAAGLPQHHRRDSRRGGQESRAGRESLLTDLRKRT